MLSAAAVNRRERSSRLSRKAMNRRLIPARSFTLSAYAKTFDIENVILLQALSKTRTADEIADLASRREDISSYFTKEFTVVRPVRRVNVDLTHSMLRDLDEKAAKLNINRQAVIKTPLAKALKREPRSPRS